MNPALSELFKAARGVKPGQAAERTRAEIIEAAFDLEAPEHISEYHLMQVERGARPLGEILRYLAGAAGVPLVECLKADGLWPPVGESRAEVILSVAESLGAEVLRHEGERLFLRVPE